MEASRILIVRTSAMGDIVHTMPLARALRGALPEATIGWVVEGHFASILHRSPAVDEVLQIDLKAWRQRPFAKSTWREIAAFTSRLQGFSADIVIDAMGNHKSGLIAALSFAGRSLGAGRKDRREPSSAMWISESVPVVGEHAIDRTLSLISGLDLPVPSAVLQDPMLFTQADEVPATPPILLHPGAGWRNKEYPAERWGQVSRELHATTGLEIGIISAPGELPLVDRVLDAAGGDAVGVPALGLEALAGRLQAARLVLAGDTGPLHLAQALGTAVLCLLGPTDPARNGAYRAPQSNLAHRLPCSYCYKRLAETKACLLLIEPATVVERALRLLEEGSNP